MFIPHSIADALRELKKLEESEQGTPLLIHDRLLSLIGSHKDDWDELSEDAEAIVVDYLPWLAGIPPEYGDYDEDLAWKQAVATVLLDNRQAISSETKAHTPLYVVFAMIAFRLLHNSLRNNQIISAALADAEDTEAIEIRARLPMYLAMGYHCASEVVTLASTLKSAESDSKANRRNRASKGAARRNRKYQDARNGFVEFYLKNRQLSRAEAARRFWKDLEDSRHPSDPPLYRSEETAVRAFTDALRRAGI
jgi:hypothetical protein